MVEPRFQRFADRFHLAIDDPPDFRGKSPTMNLGRVECSSRLGIRIGTTADGAKCHRVIVGGFEIHRGIPGPIPVDVVVLAAERGAMACVVENDATKFAVGSLNAKHRYGVIDRSIPLDAESRPATIGEHSPIGRKRCLAHGIGEFGRPANAKSTDLMIPAFNCCL